MNEFRRKNDDPLAGIDRREDVPTPSSLLVTDDRRHQLNLPVLVVGDEADRWLSMVHQQTSSAPRVISFVSAGEARWSVLPMQLGQVRGWKAVVYLYGIGADERLVKTLSAEGRHARGWLFATTTDDPLFVSAAVLLSTIQVPFTVVGAAEAARKLSQIVGREPLAVFEPSSNSPLEALKPLVRAMLDQIFS